VLLIGCGWTGIEGSGNAKTEARPHSGFDAVELSGALRAEIANAAEYRVEVSGDDNLVPLVITELEGKTLKIDIRKSVRPSLPLLVRIAAPRIGAISATGANRVALQGLKTDNLALNVSGAARVAGNGSVGTLGLAVSGNADIELDQLAAEGVTVTVTGSAKVDVAASRSLAVAISGAATVTYRGDPANVTQDISGAGRLVKR
jgi:hypothetical protein